MRVSKEEFLLINFFMDFLILALSGRGIWFLSGLRLALSAMFASAYAYIDARFRLGAAGAVLSLFTMLLIAYPVSDRRLFLRGSVTFVTAMLMMGGTMGVFAKKGHGSLEACLMGAASGTIAVMMSKAVFPANFQTKRVHLRSTLVSCTVEFSAIVDTGNLLTEPISALPVVIADQKALGRAFSEAAKSVQAFREVEYTTVSGTGRIRCIRPDRMDIRKNGKWVRAPDMWLGVYPGAFPTGVHALAPAICAQRVR